MNAYGLIRAVAVTCRNPRCEADHGVLLTRDSEAPCRTCGATHKMDEDGFYWMLEGEAQS